MPGGFVRENLFGGNVLRSFETNEFASGIKPVG